MSDADVSELEDLRKALDGMAALVEGVRPDQWTASTPCPDWNVRALVNHVVFGNRSFTRILEGQPPPPQEQIRAMRDQDQLGDDPVAAWRDSAGRLAGALAAPGVLAQTFPSPLGPMTGAGIGYLRLTETLVHGWDLATATGQPVPFGEGQARAALDFTLQQLPPGASRKGLAFGPEHAAQENAPAIDRLAAHLGREVAHDTSAGPG
jgi:uncharacterized protein (TIGR03086 family)